MAYSNFKNLLEFEKKFSIKNRRLNLFDVIPKVQVSEDLQKALLIANELPIKSEKAKSEMIVAPILIELRNQSDKFFTFFSGDTLNVDEDNDLNGECDFILAKDTGSFELSFPIMQIVEAKRNDVEIGIPQCAAQMLGAKIFNQQNGVNLDFIYGCVTTGDDWLFMKLTDELHINTKKYYLGNIEELLGVFQIIINLFR